MPPSLDTLPDELDASLPHEARELGRLSVFFVCITLTTGFAYWLNLRLRSVPVVGPLSASGLAGLALPTLAYAKYRGLDLSLSPPRPAQVGDVVAAVLTPLLALLATSVVTMVAFDTSFAALVGWTYHPKAPFVDVLSIAARFSILGRGWYGLLVVVLVELLRRRVGVRSTGTVVSTAAAGMFFHSILRETGLSLVTANAAWRFYAFAILLASTIAGGVTLGFVYRGAIERSLRVVYRPLFVPVFALGLFLFAAFATILAEVPGGFEHVLWAVAFGSAALGYERTDSVWVPLVVMFLFDVGFHLVYFFELAVF
ncbi:MULTISPECIES: hypothetical protein [Haloferax]|uniref:Uncharacterized protein n=1 Tax=Haloferax marinum TaxID=2666143 RepID=A0A6A8G6S2_9EURY|nr:MULTISPECIES: hypothetical protein [Haloferax]KAB1197745.1 hypothetical protein Hfx1150_09500 [Haloferax sp. CBA1150]MRW96799.1 hypothetical protein [Haloferax marinum]